MDLSRTVGWFTTVYPALLSLDREAGPGTALQSIKEQLRAIPANGIGYGLLRYMGDGSVAVGSSSRYGFLADHGTGGAFWTASSSCPLPRHHRRPKAFRPVKAPRRAFTLDTVAPAR